MNITIRIPSPLRRFTEQAAQIELNANTVGEALMALNAQYPDLQTQLMDEQGKLRNFVNIFHNKIDIKQLQGMESTLDEGSELRIVPAIAGGKK
ncbi:MAG: molybdopterin synthase sulfur carrier subunit [Moraxellaceae bacterium]|nr:MAG: molybdopterin synthase sulfur carrier subunit [Moraxellaceae bacterium]